MNAIEEPDLQEVAGGDARLELIDLLEQVLRQSQQWAYQDSSTITF